MTNTDRAAKVVYDTLSGKYGDFGHHEEVARALTDAGLLMPDLPPVRVDESDERPHVVISSAWPPHTARLRVDEHGKFHAINAWTNPTTPAEARERAYALLALADHAEGDTR